MSCPADTYKSSISSDTSCIECPGESTSVPGASAVSLCVCKEGFYKEDRFTSDLVCSLCPTGADCPYGTSTDPFPLPGYYKVSWRAQLAAKSTA